MAKRSVSDCVAKQLQLNLNKMLVQDYVEDYGGSVSLESIRVSELIEQIVKLNKMIDLHEKSSRDKAMIMQYKAMKKEFVVELKELLKSLQFNVSDIV